MANNEQLNIINLQGLSVFKEELENSVLKDFIIGTGVSKVVKLYQSEYDNLPLKESDTLYIVETDPKTFGGFAVASGNMYYNGKSFVISDDWGLPSDDVYGMRQNSTHFSWNECHDVNLNGWRLPTADEWETIIWDRDGATVNNTDNCRFATVRVSWIQQGRPRSFFGLLLFPDNEEITGAELSYIDTVDEYNNLSRENLKEYVDQGCVFLYCNGYYEDDYIHNLTEGYFWTSTTEDDQAYYLWTDGSTYSTESSFDMDDKYACVRLIREFQNS